MAELSREDVMRMVKEEIAKSQQENSRGSKNDIAASALILFLLEDLHGIRKSLESLAEVAMELRIQNGLISR